jgi:hypothetical protein
MMPVIHRTQGTDWRELERYWEHTTPFRSRLSISTPLSPTRPISRAREVA